MKGIYIHEHRERECAGVDDAHIEIAHSVEVRLADSLPGLVDYLPHIPTSLCLAMTIPLRSHLDLKPTISVQQLVIPNITFAQPHVAIQGMTFEQKNT